MSDIRPLGMDQQIALRTAATRLRSDFDGVFGADTIGLFLTTSSPPTARSRTSCRYWLNGSPAGACTH